MIVACQSEVRQHRINIPANDTSTSVRASQTKRQYCCKPVGTHQDQLLGTHAPTQRAHVGTHAPTQRAHVGTHAPTQRALVGTHASTQRAHVGTHAPTHRAHVGTHAPTQRAHVGSAVGRLLRIVKCSNASSRHCTSKTRHSAVYAIKIRFCGMTASMSCQKVWVTMYKFEVQEMQQEVMLCLAKLWLMF